ncbi:sensor histidine kinase [Zhongshania marina]|uniref:histidine kinase n=1 Tax=Zhongshania marina TaxID=2304603 RepID=A0A2S4HE73_9GAMM|nr:HAMP domain-containing sensor histidine kinase [Marortus luteolus]POP52267.1 hypothetical protein C0068_12890 [Marortus luteolus]
MRLPKPFDSATFRLTGLYLILFVISVSVFVALLFIQVQKVLEHETRSQITIETNLLLFEYREDGMDELLEETEERIEKSRTRDRFIYMVQNPSGRVIFDKVEPVNAPYGWRQTKGEQPTLFFYTQLESGFILGVGKDMGVLATLERAFEQTLFWSLTLALVLGTSGGLILSRRTLSRLESINRTAKAIGAGQLALRIPCRNNGDELDAHCNTLNQMFDRIEQLVNNVRQVSTGVAHDLRTPLARLRGRLETLQNSSLPIPPESLEEAIGEVDKILDIFAALLRLAELEAGSLRSGFCPVKLHTLIQNITEAYQPIAEDDGNTLKLATVDDVSIAGDVNLLQQLLANLIENALEHGGKPSEVTIGLQKSRKKIVLSVADRGPGVINEEHSYIVKPFHRLENSNGTGMGLAMVSAITRLHDGTLIFVDNEPGLRCEIHFPATSR